MPNPEIPRAPSGIEYQRVPRSIWENDGFISQAVNGEKLGTSFEISDWLRDEVLGAVNIANRMFKKETGLALISDNKGNVYQSHLEVGTKREVTVSLNAEDYKNKKCRLKPFFHFHTHVEIDGEPQFDGFSYAGVIGDLYNIAFFSDCFGCPYHGVLRSGGRLWLARKSEEKLLKTAKRFIAENNLSLQPTDDPVQYYIIELARRGLVPWGNSETTDSEHIDDKIQFCKLYGIDLYIVDLETKIGQQLI